jgi:putative nucleotidyltransferase with HDIG domain
MAIPANLIDGIKRLDPLPVTLQRLLKALRDDNTGASEVGEIVQFDHAVVAGLLRAANSAACGGWSRTESVREAVARLGKTRVTGIVFGDHFRRMTVPMPFYDLTEDDLWRHATAATLAVRAIAQECPGAGLDEMAAIAALVHDVGKLVMVRYLHADFARIVKLRQERGASFVEAEREVCGCDHAEVGGEIASHWGFPHDIGDAIARHHDPAITDPTPALDAVIVANVVAKTISAGLGAEGLDLRIDDGCLERLKLSFDAFSRVVYVTHAGLKEQSDAFARKTA